MTVPQASTDRVFRHDRIIAVNAVRAVLAGWWDRLIAVAVMAGIVALLRERLNATSWPVAVWTTCGGSAILGFGAQRLIAARLSFHGFDGVLAADALAPPVRRQYAIAWHGIGLAVLAACISIARPSLLAVGVPSYLGGALVARLAGNLRIPGLGLGRNRLAWSIRHRLHTPIAGIIAAVILAMWLLSARTLQSDAALAVAGIATVLLGFTLTPVADDVVRFMAVAGHGASQTVVHHSKSLATFAVLGVVSAGSIVGSAAAGVVAVLSLTLMLLLVLRILTYRLHDKRIADVLVSVVIGVILLSAYAVPVALPFVIFAVLWHLHRRGRSKTWLLA